MTLAVNVPSQGNLLPFPRLAPKPLVDLGSPAPVFSFDHMRFDGVRRELSEREVAFFAMMQKAQRDHQLLVAVGAAVQQAVDDQVAARIFNDPDNWDPA